LTGGSAINPVERRANACLTLLQADAASALLGKVMKPGSVSANALEARSGMHTADIAKMDRCSFSIGNNPLTVACCYNAKNRIAINFFKGVVAAGKEVAVTRSSAGCLIYPAKQDTGGVSLTLNN